VQFRDPSFLLRTLEKLTTLAPYQRLALMPHPDRHTVREEYEYVVRQIDNGNEYFRLRYAPEKMTEQMNSFIDRGWNLDARLWASGVWLIENDDLITRCWDGWWDQTRRYRMTLDQLSLPVLLGHFGLEPQAMDFNLWHNPFFELVKHRASM
jgi:hypothetical protein